MKNLLFISVVLIFLCGFISSLTIAQDGNKINSKYDFIPGEKVIFYDDFSTETVGDFPVQWNTNGSGEIVTASNYEGRWFQITKGGYYIPYTKEDFTDNFTVEFDIVPTNIVGSEAIVGIDFFFLSGDADNPGYGGQPGQAGFKMKPDYDVVFWNNWSEAREWQGDNGQVAFTFNADEKYHLSFWVQKQRVRVYVNENKILDVPKGLQANYKYNIFRIETTDDANPIISNFRIAAGLPDMRNKLITEGKLISYGITFDVNSDKIKPESFATIKEIAQVLKDNPAVKIKVVGHTDSDGDDKSNLDLSKRRAASVKNSLVKDFSIDETRIETDGKGESEPIAKNDSGVNKAKNRRVEFIKL
ncbi:MAG: OmpA family protein [Ignavibacteriales bacterium]|nr:OmpA family protein [Ignavibacteriales bacterium]